MPDLRFLALSLLLISFAASAQAGTPAAPDMSKAYGSAWRPDFEKWLPAVSVAPVNHVVPTPDGRPSVSQYFMCQNEPVSTIPATRFDYALSGCPMLSNQGTKYYTGMAGPQRGNVVYDRVHQIVLFSRGCCSVESAIVAAGIGPPSTSVYEADLTNVRTSGGLKLGMSIDAVEKIFGPTAQRSVTGRPGLVVLLYGTKPPQPSQLCGGDAGKQTLTLAFRNTRLTYIEIGTGC